MGCCTSREATTASSSPYPAVSSADAQDASSSRHITSAASPPHTSPRASPSAARPNVPLKPLDPSHRSKLPSTLASPTAHIAPLSDSTHALWTRRRLEKERADWWDTRTTGDAEIWGALRVAVACLQRGEVGEAQALLDALECTCPNGWVWRGVFDRRGEWYRVPEWVVVEPEGLVEDGGEEVGGMGAGRTGKGKGKSVAVGGEDGMEGEGLGELVKVRVRLSADGRDVSVSMRKGAKVAALIGNLKAKAKISPFASVRIVYGGKIFDENAPLEANPLWNFDNHHVLVAMVFE